MLLQCSLLLQDDLKELNTAVGSLSKHPWLSNNVTILVQGERAIFCSEKGFRFRRIQTNLKQTIHDEIFNPLQCLCSAFSINETTPDILEKLLDSFTEKHGSKLVKTIDTVSFVFNNDNLMLMNLPSGIVRHMMAPSGGLVSTQFSGPIAGLRTIPTLLNYGNLPDDAITYKGCITTEYKAGGYEAVLSFHYNLVREVCEHPGAGVTLSHIAKWDA